MVIVLLICEALAQDDRGNIHEPEGPCFSCIMRSILGNIGKVVNIRRRDVLNSVRSFQADIFPNFGGDFICFGSSVEAFEITGIKVNLMGYDIFTENMEPFPWKRDSEVNSLHAVQKRAMANTIVL